VYLYSLQHLHIVNPGNILTFMGLTDEYFGVLLLLLLFVVFWFVVWGFFCI